jgi:NAD(P)-dependent dehydrogenase (short-subunit alcohol dehydrogenase family)
VDYATAGIRINAVSPGPVVTDLAATSAQFEGKDFPALGPAGAPDIAAVSASEVKLPELDDPGPRLFVASSAMDIAFADFSVHTHLVFVFVLWHYYLGN